MLTNHTVEILKSLNKEELRRFGDFIRSPYFNTSKPVERIFEIVYKTYPDFNGSSLEFKNIFKKLYPADAYNEKRIKNLYSEFSNLLKKFLGFERISTNKEELDIHIVDALTQKDLNRISDKVIAKSLKDSDDGLLSIADRFNYLYQLNVFHLSNIEHERRHGSEEYQKSDIELIEKMIIFFFMNIFQQSFYDVMNQNIFKSAPNPALMEVINATDIDKILSYFSSNNHPYASYMKIHFLFYYYSLNDITEEKYNEFKKEILGTIYKVRKNDQSQFIMRTIHLILAKVVSQNQKYYEDIIEFAQLFTILKIYPDDKFQIFNLGTFEDIFITAISLKKYEWAEKFVTEYINYISKDVRENTENYCRGILSYNFGRYTESLSYLSKVKLVGMSEKINIRFYYMMNYIQLESYESALSSLQSFRQFVIDTTEIPEMFAEGINETLKYFAEIIRSKEKAEPANEFILKEAKGNKPYFFKGYILEKLSETKIK